MKPGGFTIPDFVSGMRSAFHPASKERRPRNPVGASIHLTGTKGPPVRYFICKITHGRSFVTVMQGFFSQECCAQQGELPSPGAAQHLKGEEEDQNVDEGAGGGRHPDIECKLGFCPLPEGRQHGCREV